MIQYKDACLTIDCDNCGINDYYDGSLQGCFDRAKHNDWISIKDNEGGWLNFCCRECEQEHFANADAE